MTGRIGEEARQRSSTYLLFGLVGGYALALSIFRQPAVHYYFDAVGIRDAGLSLAAVLSGDYPLIDFVFGILSHVEGSLQYISLNLYCVAVGYFVPLSPTTLAVPNAVLLVAIFYMFVRIGRECGNPRYGVLAGLAYVALPWIVTWVRLPHNFNGWSNLTELVVVYQMIRFVGNRPGAGARLSAAIAVYLFTGLDWPLFGLLCFLYIAMNGKLIEFLGLKANLIIVVPLAIYAGWAALLYANDNPAYLNTLLLRPFTKTSAGDLTSIVTASSLDYLAVSTGLQTAFAGIGIFLHLVSGNFFRRLAFPMTAALVLGLPPLLANATSPGFSYVVSIPIAWLSAGLLMRLTPVLRGVTLVGLVVWQGYVLSHHFTVVADGGDKRVHAVAAFLLDQHPELLAADKSAFVPLASGPNIANHTRSRFDRLFTRPKFLSPDKLDQIPERAVRTAVRAYLDGEKHPFDWFILAPEHLQSEGGWFYRKLFDDPNVQWLASFADGEGRAIWVGQFEGKPEALSSLPVLDVETYAEMFEKNFSSARHLRQNLDKVNRY